MRTKKVTVRTKNGLHMRVVGRIVDVSRQSRSVITFRKDTAVVDTRSFMDLLMLAATEGTEIEIVVDGSDEEKTLRELEQVLIDGAGI
jgi:phosphocarrier protein HPr